MADRDPTLRRDSAALERQILAVTNHDLMNAVSDHFGVIMAAYGAAVGVKLWTHAIRHTAITVAIEKGQQAGIGLDQIRHFSRHKQLATMLLYRDEVDHAATHLGNSPFSHGPAR